MSKIILLNKGDLEAKFLQLVKIAHNVRKHKRKWEKEYGSVNRSNLADWEEKLDSFLESLNIAPDEKIGELKGAYHREGHGK